MGSKLSATSLNQLPRRLPIFPLAGALLLPRTHLPLHVFEPRYLAMVDDALGGHRMIGMIQPLGDDRPAGGIPPLHAIGCAGKITSFAEVGDGRLLVTLTGITRFAVARELEVPTPYRQIEADYERFADDLKLGHGEETIDRQQVLSNFRAFLRANELEADWKEIRAASNEVLINSLSCISPFAIAEKQALLESPDLSSRAELLVALTEMSLKRAGGSPSGRLQ